MHDPAPVMCTVVPATVQLPLAENDTGRPEEAAAEIAKSGSPYVWSTMGSKVMVCPSRRNAEDSAASPSGELPIPWSMVGTTVHATRGEPLEARAVDATIAAAGPSMDNANVDGFTILYVEDNLANLKLVERLVERRPGIRLLSALQGRLGVDLARQHRPDLILLDLHLPDIPGEEVLAHLREESSTRDIPVVVISADATGSQIKRLMAAGARAYLTKPLDVKAFVHVIDEVAADRARLM